MELIPINESKLKIMLDESDMKEYNIGSEADCANSETRLAIRHILDRAKTQIGFNTEGSEIFVQLYTSKGGGCELFVTKSTLATNTPVTPSAPPEKKAKKRSDAPVQKSLPDTHVLPPQAAPKGKRGDTCKNVYSFDNIKELCRVCGLIATRDISSLSSAYKGDNGLYYLILEGDGIREYSRLDKLTFIREFGEKEIGYDVYTYLSEHASIICKSNAVNILSQF